MFTSFAMYAQDEDLREVKSGEIFSIQNMSDRELREAIIQDILSPTMWEIEKNETVDFDMVEFLRFVPNTGDRQRVMHMMWHEEISGLIEGKDGQPRIKKDRASMQAAMDYCGVWGRGFDMPEGVLVTDHEVTDDTILTYGSIENFVAALALDSAGNVPGNTTVH